jgi:hypothetical protein
MSADDELSDSMIMKPPQNPSSNKPFNPKFNHPIIKKNIPKISKKPSSHH